MISFMPYKRFDKRPIFYVHKFILIGKLECLNYILKTITGRNKSKSVINE